MLVPSAQAGGIFALYRKNRIVMPIFTKWRKSANLFLQIGGLPLYTLFIMLYILITAYMYKIYYMGHLIPDNYY